ncbi:Glutathione S-transferase, C-terminal domain [Popillia japonica]|uniref:glutathione transferase n=1 Tax=Popillia japonica TaxID=7064 RepID=A0AAW1M9Q3_POPJA
MSTTKLIYFPLKGVGEPIRWLLKYGNIEYEDILIGFDDWPKIKPTTPFGQIPLYEENGKKINESIAISRYLGKKVNLIGENDWENLEIDAIVDTINDLRLKLKKYGYEKDEKIKEQVKGPLFNEIRLKLKKYGYEKDEKIKEQVKGPLFNEILPYYMERMEKIAEANNGYLAINKLTWADFYFIGILDYFNYMAEMDILKGKPVLEKLREKVTNIPAIKEWIAVRPDTWYM